MTEYVYVCGECTDCAITTDERLSNRLSCPNCDAEIDLADETPDVRDDEIEQGDYGVSDIWNYKGDVKPSHSETPKEAVKRKIESQSESETVDTDEIKLDDETDDTLRNLEECQFHPSCDQPGLFKKLTQNLCQFHVLEYAMRGILNDKSRGRIELVSTDTVIDGENITASHIPKEVIADMFVEFHHQDGKLVITDGGHSYTLHATDKFKQMGEIQLLSKIAVTEYLVNSQQETRR
ncbi:hypothetical protein OSG_eHP24_00050 [environmental Halophage eHP-24]|jgi:hypothetical protein|nr:hypothetical protein OSG_eHP24_00050 [environmental Halophage eHP-24]